MSLRKTLLSVDPIELAKKEVTSVGNTVRNVVDLTADELCEIAIESGQFDAEGISSLRATFHNANLFRSTLDHRLKNVLHNMRADGLLTLRTHTTVDDFCVACGTKPCRRMA